MSEHGAKTITEMSAAPKTGSDLDDAAQDGLFSFDVEYLHPKTRERLNGRFIFRAGGVDTEQDIALRAARLANGVRWESLPVSGRELLMALATFGACLVEAPEWFKKRTSSEIFADLVMELYAGYLQANARFFRGSEGTGGEAEAKPALVVVEVRGERDGTAR